MAFLCIAWAPDGWRSRTFHEDAAGPDRGYTHQPNAAVAQLARASACHAEGREFESLQPLDREALLITGFFFCRKVVVVTNSGVVQHGCTTFGGRGCRFRPPSSARPQKVETAMEATQGRLRSSRSSSWRRAGIAARFPRASTPSSRRLDPQR